MDIGRTETEEPTNESNFTTDAQPQIEAEDVPQPEISTNSSTYNLRPRDTLRRPDVLTLPIGAEDDRNDQSYTLLISDADTDESIGAYPITCSEAMKLFESETDQAADVELGNFVQKDVLEPIDPSKLSNDDLRRAIPSKAFVKVVLLPDGSIKKEDIVKIVHSTPLRRYRPILSLSLLS